MTLGEILKIHVVFGRRKRIDIKEQINKNEEKIFQKGVENFWEKIKIIRMWDIILKKKSERWKIQKKLKSTKWKKK